MLHTSSTEIFPAVLSIGYNPFYANTTRSIEIHILHEFHHDFYGASLNLLMLGYIRPEYDYVSKEGLIEDIKIDCDVARRSLERSSYQKCQEEAWLRDFAWKDSIDIEKAERDMLNMDGEAKM
jgi:riboflavin kinase